MIGLRSFIVTLGLVVLTTWSGVGYTKDRSPVGVARSCRHALGRSLAHLARVGFREVDRCEARKAAGRRAGDCTTLRTGSGKRTAYRLWEHRAEAIALARCPIDTTARISFPVKEIGTGIFTGDPTVAIPEITNTIEASARTLQAGTTAVATVAPATSAPDCLAAVASARSLVATKTMQTALRCQRERDRTSSTFGPLDPGCQLPPPDAAVREAAGLIAGRCAGFTGPDAGTCGPLPGCVLDAAIETGFQLARAVFGECGNGVVDANEACDDGNVDPDDGCNQCLAPICGNGKVEGDEACDDGNPIDNDGCTDCQLGVCGDGVREVGVEECDDGNEVDFDGCTDCQFDPVACSSAGVLATVTFEYDSAAFVPILGMRVRVGYDPAALSIPGSLVGPTINQRVRNLTGVTPASYGVADRDFLPSEEAPDGVDDTLQTLIALSSGEIPSGPFQEIRFDCLDDDVRGSQVSCAVLDVTDPFGNKVDDAVTATQTRCSITFEAAPVQ